MKKLNIRGFFVGEKGQRLFNYAYSIGASIVILGALFELLHAPMAHALLIIGMGTEAIIFFLSAFDDPTSTARYEQMQEHAATSQSPVASAPVVSNVTPVAGNVTPVVGNVTPLNINTEEVNDATTKYVEQLKNISEQMTALNRSVQGIEAIYEVQLKSASSQLGSVEQVSEQTKQLVQNLQQLNELYGRMISAMAPSQQQKQ